MTMDPALPPWRARNERERQAMIDWAIAKLDEEDAAERRRLVGDADLNAPWTPRFPDPPPGLSPEKVAERAAAWDTWLRDGGLEEEAAKHGVIGPARARARRDSPRLAALVQLPQLKRGEKYLRFGGISLDDHRRDADGRFLAFLEAVHDGHVAAAAKDVKRIRKLWQACYDGLKNRHDHDGPSAVDIAAERQTRLIDRTYGQRSPVHSVSPGQVAKFLRRK